MIQSTTPPPPDNPQFRGCGQSWTAVARREPRHRFRALEKLSSIGNFPSGRKAAVNAPQSKRCRDHRAPSNGAERWTAVALAPLSGVRGFIFNPNLFVRGVRGGARSDAPPRLPTRAFWFTTARAERRALPAFARPLWRGRECRSATFSTRYCRARQNSFSPIRCFPLFYALKSKNHVHWNLHCNRHAVRRRGAG